MCERVGNDVALSLFLQSIVTDGFGCIESFINIALVEDFFRMISPNTGIKIGLKFDTDG